MPPKKPPNVREQQKKLQKAIDDKTFGLKKTAKNKSRFTFNLSELAKVYLNTSF